MSTAVLERETFRTSRLLDFASRKELVAQTGHEVGDWPRVIIKELLDNALDACEEAGIAPDIAIKIDGQGIEVSDNGPGLPAETVKDILDFRYRVSSCEAYVSPTRGAQGNALKTLIAMPFVLDGQGGKIEIEARGTRHTIIMGVDHIRQEPTIQHGTAAGGNRGTRVKVHLANSACSIDDDDKAQFLLFAESFAWLNPHLSLTVDMFGKEIHRRIIRTTKAWSKWKPSTPTSPHWYTPERLGRLIAAYISHDADKGHQRTVGDFLGKFGGLSGTAKRKAILEETGLFRAPLSQLVKGNDLDHGTIERLLEAMQKASKPVKPEALGIIGKEHLKSRFQAMGCDMGSFQYRCIKKTTDGLPYVVETAFGWCESLPCRRLVTGVNWSPGIRNPFRSLGKTGGSLDTILSQQRVDRDEPVILVLHMACPRVEYTDRGKSAVVIQ